MLRIPAHVWIEKVDEARERILGVATRVIVDAPIGMDYPKDYKFCSCCGERSKYRLNLDGTNYYCSKLECQRSRVMFYDRREALGFL